MTTQEIKYALYSIDTDYIAGVISASDYAVQAEELSEAIKASEDVDTLIKLWNKHTELMAGNI